MKTAIIGGGAAGFFLAINLKEMIPEMQVTIFERSKRVLSKVEISGGGRCNCTNSFNMVRDLSAVYPRGHRLMKRLFNVFDYNDTYQWFESHGVPLVTQNDECVFPQVQDSHAIIDCFLSLAKKYHIEICTGQDIHSMQQVEGYDYVVVTTGGSPHSKGLQWLAELGHEIVPPVPSLFSLRIDNDSLTALQGLVVDAVAHIPGTKFRANGPLLITHWGISGPCILKLSSYAARYLAENEYKQPLSINWTTLNENDILTALHKHISYQQQKQITTCNPFALPQRLWVYLLNKALDMRATIRWGELNKKNINRLVNILTNDICNTAGRAPFRDEFVTCGGVSLKSVSLSTLESKVVPNLFFAGEVLDIDGITGGFNFQAAWTTAVTAAKGITQNIKQQPHL